MKVRWASNIGGISFSVLLFASVFVIINSTGYSDAEEAPANNGTSSIDSDEVTAASGSNRFVVWVNGEVDVFFRRSTDNGATWKPVKNLSNTALFSYSSNPQIAVSGSNVYVVWQELDASQETSTIRFIRSTDNGATWGSVVIMPAQCGAGCVSDQFATQLAGSGSNVYVVWKNEVNLVLRRSTDNGATWKPIVNLRSNPGPTVPQLAVSGSSVHVVWVDYAAGNYDILSRRSTDNGATWKTAKNLSNNPGVSGGAQIALAGSSVYVVWQDSTPGKADTFFRRSTDNGATWNAVKNLSLNAGDSVNPQVAFSGTNVYVAWSDDTPGNNDIFIRRSTDNGATWKSAINLSKNPGDSHFPQIATSGSNAYVVWHQQNPDKTLVDVFFRRSTDNGATWKFFKNLSSNGHSGGPQIAVSGANVFVVWTNNAVGNGDIFFQRSTDNGATWKSAKNLSSNDSGSYGPQIGV